MWKYSFFCLFSLMPCFFSAGSFAIYLWCQNWCRVNLKNACHWRTLWFISLINNHCPKDTSQSTLFWVLTLVLIFDDFRFGLMSFPKAKRFTEHTSQGPGPNAYDVAGSERLVSGQWSLIVLAGEQNWNIDKNHNQGWINSETSLSWASGKNRLTAEVSPLCRLKVCIFITI